MIRYRLHLRGLTVLALGSILLGACGDSASKPTDQSAERESRSLHVADFGAVGDGVTDDGPALQAALAALAGAERGTVLNFDAKVYRLEPRQDHWAQIDLSGMSHRVLDGHGATLLTSPDSVFFHLQASNHLTIRGFRCDYDPLPFSQGAIVGVDPSKKSIVLEIAKGYPLPPSQQWMTSNHGKDGWWWGSVMDAKAAHLKWSAPSHFRIDRVEPIETAPRRYRITLRVGSAKALAQVKVGDRFFLPIRSYDQARKQALLTKGDAMAAISVWASAECQFEDITLWATSGMGFLLLHNEGRITLEGCRIEIKPGSDRLISSYKDGVHAKDNRLGPHILRSHFHGLMDDSIHVSGTTWKPLSQAAKNRFELYATFRKGDRVRAFDVEQGRHLGDFSVRQTASAPGPKGRPRLLVTLDHASLTIGEESPPLDLAQTPGLRFVNLSACTGDWRVEQCEFRTQRRHAIIARAPKGTVQGNTMSKLGGSALWLANEAQFEEGPAPSEVTVIDNTVKDCHGAAFVIASDASKSQSPQILTKDLRFSNNSVRASYAPALRISHGAGVAINDLSVEVADSLPVDTVAIELLGNVRAIYLNQLSVTDPRINARGAVHLNPTVEKSQVQITAPQFSLATKMPAVAGGH